MNFKNIIIFEGENLRNFYPFNIMHPVWEMRCGILRLFEKIIKQFPDANVKFIGRELHTQSFIKRFNIDNNFDISGNTLIVDAQVIFNRKFRNILSKINNNSIIKYQNKVVAYFVDEI